MFQDNQFKPKNLWTKTLDLYISRDRL